MKTAQTKTANPVRVIRNTVTGKNQWAKIVDCQTGRVLHTGQLKHIKYVARKKFNLTLV